MSDMLDAALTVLHEMLTCAMVANRLLERVYMRTFHWERMLKPSAAILQGVFFWFVL
jgi:hypothetical protein